MLESREPEREKNNACVHYNLEQELGMKKGGKGILLTDRQIDRRIDRRIDGAGGSSTVPDPCRFCLGPPTSLKHTSWWISYVTCKGVCVVFCDELASHPGCITASNPVLLGDSGFMRTLVRIKHLLNINISINE